MKLEKRPLPEVDQSYPEDEVVTIEPLPGHGDEEISTLFKGAGAEPPHRLAPRFWSGKVPVHLREGVCKIAAVHRKPLKRMY